LFIFSLKNTFDYLPAPKIINQFKSIFMKKIGVLHGKERSFPMAFVERVNSKNISGITAEPVHIDKAMQGEPTGYAVIIDRISQDVPFYRTSIIHFGGAPMINTLIIA
jgi:hypothetical protein